MKTKNNVQQAILKSMAVVFSLAILSVTVNAQDFWKSIYENNGFKDIALAMADVSTETTTELIEANTFSAFLEVESEEALDIENWMLNETNFAPAFSIVEEIESPMEVKEWMTDESKFNHTTFELIEENESELEVEEWMLNDGLFNVNEETDQPLVMEEWMTSENVWNN